MKKDRSMKFLAPFALAATFGLVGCNTLTSQSGDTPHMAAGKALKDVSDAVTAAANMADSAAVTGILHGAPAAAAADDLKQVQAALTAARTAYLASDDATVQADVVLATTLAADITLIVSQAKGAPSGS